MWYAQHTLNLLHSLRTFLQNQVLKYLWDKYQMATDLKRIPAPESTPYHLSARQKTQSYQEKLATILQGGQRQDKRKFEETRKICKWIHSTIIVDVLSILVSVGISIFSSQAQRYIESKRFRLYWIGKYKSDCIGIWSAWSGQQTKQFQVSAFYLLNIEDFFNTYSSHPNLLNFFQLVWMVSYFVSSNFHHLQRNDVPSKMISSKNHWPFRWNEPYYRRCAAMHSRTSKLIFMCTWSKTMDRCWQQQLQQPVWLYPMRAFQCTIL